MAVIGDTAVGPGAADIDPRRGGVGRPCVHMLARKALIQNTRVIKQATSLVWAGYDVTVIGVRSPGSAEREQVAGATIVRVPVTESPHSPRVAAAPLRWLGYYWRSYRAVVRAPTPPTTIHANDLDALPVAVLLGRRLRVPVVYDAPDLLADQENVPRWFSRLLTLLERRLIRRVDRVIAVNDEIADVIARRHKVQIDAVVRNCPPFEALATDPSEPPTVRDALGIPAGELLLIYSGALSPGRGLENLITSLRHLDGGHLVFLGEGPLHARLERHAARSGLADQVSFTGFRPYLAVPRFISSADIGVVPYENVALNNYLCSPNKLFHYIMAELPIACSDFPFLRRIVLGNRVGASFDPADPSSIARAVNEIWETPGAIDAYRQRLRQIKRSYCWEEEERRFLGVYESLPTRERAARRGGAA